MVKSLILLCFVINEDRIDVDEKNVGAIYDWPTPKAIIDIRIFHGFVTFSRRFIRNFSTIVSPLTDCLKRASFSRG